MKSIGKLVNEKGYFAYKNISLCNIYGLFIGCMMEEAKILDFTMTAYDINSKKVLDDYHNILNKVLYSHNMNTLFFKINDESGKNYSLTEFMRTIQFNLKNTRPAFVHDALGHQIEYERNPEMKTELQLMELVMLSRLPSVYITDICQKFRLIDGNNIHKSLMPEYNKAIDYFL